MRTHGSKELQCWWLPAGLTGLRGFIMAGLFVSFLNCYFCYYCLLL